MKKCRYYLVIKAIQVMRGDVMLVAVGTIAKLGLLDVLIIPEN